MKYVAIVSSHHGCPAHDSSSATTPFFFDHGMKLLEFVKDNLNDLSVESIYDCETGEEANFSVEYEYGPRGHVYHGAKVTSPLITYRLVDDGHGTKVWKEEP
jgi:hypothetical protein